MGDHCCEEDCSCNPGWDRGRGHGGGAGHAGGQRGAVQLPLDRLGQVVQSAVQYSETAQRTGNYLAGERVMLSTAW